MNIKVASNAGDTIKELQSDLEKYQKNLEFQMFRAISVLEAEILANIRSKSGLHVRTGNLLNSVEATKKVYRDASDNVVGEIGSQGVPYARIHEFGGRTKAHDIRPRVADALHFMAGGKEVFAKVVHHPGSNIPARPYLRPALAATEEKILKEFGLFLRAVFPVKG